MTSDTIAQRGEKLELLVEKTDDLSHSVSKHFEMSKSFIRNRKPV